uniref:ABC transporter domain-containing protein n=1 Tax=Spongospora subterranea TaxID=70186 RepID=A0A0H5R766_9EUKA|eukprot:CRZ09980.1 hypothetical protein [Spongospora subterranea]
MRRVKSVPALSEDGGDLDGTLTRANSNHSLQGVRHEENSNAAGTVMERLEGILGTSDLEGCDLNTITKMQFAKIISIMQEFNLIEQPATLVWKDLSFIRDDRRVFQGISGFIKPGSMVCCIGPSASGVSSFLRVLAGRQQAGTVHGSIFLNGLPPAENFRKVVSYVPFEDLHIDHMKVKEAIRFSIALRASPLIPQRLLDLQARIILHLLKLTHRARSKIGGANVRGISGGERRRLTIGLEFAAGNSIMVMDSPTNGLDSVSAGELVDITQALTKSGRSVIMSLVQVSMEILSKFDYVICLSRSVLIYFGPVSQVLQYFQCIGYRKPSSRSLPDFLADVCADPGEHYVGGSPLSELQINPNSSSFWSKSETQYFSLSPSSCDRVKGGSARALAHAYRESVLFEEVGRVIWKEQNQSENIAVLSSPSHEKSLAGAVREVLSQVAKTIPKHKAGAIASGFNSTVMAQFTACLMRAVILNFREKSKSIGRLARAILVAIVTGTVFWQLENSQAGALSRIGAIAVVAGFIGYDAADEIPQIFQSRSMFYAQRNAGYFSAFSYFLASLIADFPIILTQTTIFSVIVYSMIGMRDGVFSIRFFIFALLVLQIGITGRAWTTFVANMITNESVAITLALVTNDLFWYFQGYFRPVQAIPSFLRWLNYISYFTRLFQALAVNELSGMDIDCLAHEKLCRWSTGSDLLQDYSWNTGSGPLKLWAESFLVLGVFHVLSIVCMFVLNYEVTDADEKVGSSEQSNPVQIGNTLDSAVTTIEMGKNITSAIKGEPSSEHVRMQTMMDVGTHLYVKSLTYKVKDITLLNDINMYATPGMLIAMMGPSGAGKSTLLDVLALRKNTGTVTGTILVNGEPLQKQSFRRRCAYVEQFDSLPMFCTVRDVIECSAQLRLSKHVTAAARAKIVENVLENLRIKHVQNEIAVNLGGALRKKTSIAVELASIQPDSGILFCDEATTGLDSPAAMDVISCISRVAQHTPVICTIHQPSSELMSSIPWLLLLRRNGILAYFGKTEQIPDYCVSQGYPPIEPEENLAEYCLRTICSSAPNSLISPVHEPPVLASVPDCLSAEATKPSSSSFSRPSLLHTFIVLLRRRFKCELRDRSSLLTRLASLLVIGCVIGSMFYQLPLTYSGFTGRFSFCYTIINLVCWAQASKVSNIINDRPSYYRELSLGMYGEATYFLAETFAESPIIIMQVLCLCVPSYFLSGFAPLSIFSFILTVWLCAEASAGTVRLLAALSPNTVIAGGLITAVYTTLMSFSGFLLVYSAMPSFSRSIFYISFFRYAMFALVGGEAKAMGVLNCSDGGSDGDCSDAILAQYAVDPSQQWFYVLELIPIIIISRVLAVIALKFVKHIRR